MRALLSGNNEPRYLDKSALDLLSEGRKWYENFELDENNILETDEGKTLIFTWKGTIETQTLSLSLQAMGIRASSSLGPITVECENDREQVEEKLAELASSPPPSAVSLASIAANLSTEKFHRFLSRELLVRDAASSRITTECIPQLARDILQH